MKKLIFRVFLSVFVSLVLLSGINGYAVEKYDGMDTETRLEALRTEIKANDYTFTVGHNPAMAYSLSELCTLDPDLAYLSDIEIDVAPIFAEGISKVMALPSAYMGPCCETSCSHVGNQGSCGSCWAFGSVGAVECAFKHQAGLCYDLSEQQVLDCNPYGYSCSGGWFAFSQAKSPGLTTESNYPYVGYKKSCTVTSPYYPIYNAYYVGSSSSVPPAADIKQAIYDYGCVAAAVYANYAFQAYSGGVFNRCRNGTVNHAIVLCGWDDSKRAWRLKNSWGTGWGEGGYMWIRYRCNKVGYAACFVVI